MRIFKLKPQKLSKGKTKSQPKDSFLLKARHKLRNFTFTTENPWKKSLLSAKVISNSHLTGLRKFSLTICRKISQRASKLSTLAVKSTIWKTCCKTSAAKTFNEKTNQPHSVLWKTSTMNVQSAHTKKPNPKNPSKAVPWQAKYKKQQSALKSTRWTQKNWDKLKAKASTQVGFWTVMDLIVAMKSCIWMKWGQKTRYELEAVSKVTCTNFRDCWMKISISSQPSKFLKSSSKSLAMSWIL